jgi:hypothetical protein
MGKQKKQQKWGIGVAAFLLQRGVASEFAVRRGASSGVKVRLPGPGSTAHDSARLPARGSRMSQARASESESTASTGPVMRLRLGCSLRPEP